MKRRTYSKKERESRRLMRNVVIAVMILLLLVITLIVTDTNDGERQYTAEEMLHDHDGDGIPDH